MSRYYLYSAVVVLVAGLVLRVALIARQGLGDDEIFSIAVASGHSLEQPAGESNSVLGDYVELPRPVPASFYQTYTKDSGSAGGLARVVRAVSLSDTSPPLYYMLLHAWMRGFGQSDSALRIFSILWWVACFPLVWLIGAEIGGSECAYIACLLFAAAPASLYNSVEGRMYAMLWFFSASVAWLTMILPRTIYRRRTVVLWSTCAAAGLLTHYFFVFPLAACVLWFVFDCNRHLLRLLGTALAIVLVVVGPWYTNSGQSLGRWRVTRDWLAGFPGAGRALGAPVRLAGSFVGSWASGTHTSWWNIELAVPLVIILVVFGRRILAGNIPREVTLVMMWMGSACIGPVIFDLIMHTHTSSVERYALAGMPAGFLLLAVGVKEIQGPKKFAVIGLLLLAWLPRVYALFEQTSRTGEAFRDIAEYIGHHRQEGQVVIIDSIPSGVLGVARYLPADTAMVSWVGRLGNRRVPENIQALLKGSSELILVKIDSLNDAAPEESWLRANGRLVGETKRGEGEILVFVPSPEKLSYRGRGCSQYLVASPADGDSRCAANNGRSDVGAACQ